MNYRLLGKTGLLVSELCLGTMTFGGKGFWEAIGKLGQETVNDIVATQHARLGGECVLELSVVEAGGSLCDHQHDLVACPQADRLCDLVWLHPMSDGGEFNRRRALFSDDDFDFGSFLGKKCTYGFKAHALHLSY